MYNIINIINNIINICEDIDEFNVTVILSSCDVCRQQWLWREHES